MDILYNVNDHVQYWVYPGKTRTLVAGRIISLGETGHKTALYQIKRDRLLIGNLGMYELDTVSPMNILGIVPTNE